MVANTAHNNQRPHHHRQSSPSSLPSHPLSFSASTSSTSNDTKKRPLVGDRVSRKYRLAAVRRAEYRRLKALVPTIAKKRSVSKLAVIEEAIRYIDELHTALACRLTHASPSQRDLKGALEKPLDNADEMVRRLFSNRDSQLQQLRNTNKQKQERQILPSQQTELSLQQKQHDSTTPPTEQPQERTTQQQQHLQVLQHQPSVLTWTPSKTLTPEETQLFQQQLLNQQQQIRFIQEHRNLKNRTQHQQQFNAFQHLFEQQQSQQLQQRLNQSQQQEALQTKSCRQRQPLANLHQPLNNFHVV